MLKQIYVNTYNFTMTVDHVGGLLRTDVYQLDNGLFNAYSSYWRDEDEEIVGFAQCHEKKEAIQFSRDELRKEWVTEQDGLAASPIAEEAGDILYMGSGEVIKLKEFSVTSSGQSDCCPS